MVGGRCNSGWGTATVGGAVYVVSWEPSVIGQCDTVGFSEGIWCM
jgi:hypothetical protein